MSVSERFWSKVDKQGPDDCWNWTASRIQGGYGWFSIDYRGWLAHRVAWTLTNGPIPEGMCVLHDCDNPACCNPLHLFPGTLQDNVDDMVRKGRQTNLKLTGMQVLRICRRYKAGGVTYRELAAEYGITRDQIGKIIRRESRDHF